MAFILLLGVFLLSFIVIFFAAISGGVGLITTPVLIFLGYTPAAVISSSKVSGFVADWPSLYVLRKNIDWKLVAFLAIPMTIGMVIASIAVITVLKSSLDIALGILLLFAGILFLFKNKMGVLERKKSFSKLKVHVMSFIGTTILSFFNTLSGGLGPLFSLLYIYLYGKTFISVSALWRMTGNIASIFAVIIFIVSGIVDWGLCIALILGLSLGSYFGTKYGLKKGENWVRYIVLIVTFAGAIKLLFFR